MDHSECGKLFDASTTLFKESGLIEWDSNCFIPRYPGQGDNEFEDWLKGEVDHKFGRYISWVLFSVASENLIKAAFACLNISHEFSKDPLNQTLDAILRKRRSAEGMPSLLREMCQFANLGTDDIETLEAGFIKLKGVRNRDVHRYEQDKRRYNFYAVEGEFIPAFNILRSCMKTQGHFAVGHGNPIGN